MNTCARRPNHTNRKWRLRIHIACLKIKEKIMRAVLMNAPGDPDVLKIADIPKPSITDSSEVLVKLHAAGVNPIDTKVRKLNMYYPDKLPSILGCDGAGVVEAIGSSVTRVRPGDEVFFFNNGLG